MREKIKLRWLAAAIAVFVCTLGGEIMNASQAIALSNSSITMRLAISESLARMIPPFIALFLTFYLGYMQTQTLYLKLVLFNDARALLMEITELCQNWPPSFNLTNLLHGWPPMMIYIGCYVSAIAFWVCTLHLHNANAREKRRPNESLANA